MKKQAFSKVKEVVFPSCNEKERKEIDMLNVVDAFMRIAQRGEFRAPDDVGGGSTEDISNIHKSQEE
ncbi:MAG: hypothetical protein IJ927_03850 [Eubacterium sp.]|nr:hypothetical protein [Eubacterium sp.]